jgi:Holliday junction resolvase
MGPYSPLKRLLPIARHAKELIEHSSEHLENGSEKDLLISLVHIDNSVEIMLKEHMRFKRNISWGQIEKMFFPQLLDACAQDLETIENNKNQFTAFHDIRNALYHAGTFVPRKEDVESALYFSKSLFNEIHPDFSFEKIEAIATSIDTINFLAKEYGVNRPYVTEYELTQKIALKLQKEGYKVRVNTRISGTALMPDILLTRNNEVIVVEIKARSTGKILNSSVYQLAGYVSAIKKVVPSDSKVEGWLITNTAFNMAAKKTAVDLNLRLISGEELAQMLDGATNSPYLY